MQGVATGTGIEFLDVLAINCRYELTWPPKGLIASTAIGTMPPGSSNVLLAQNADLLPEFQTNQLLLIVRGEPAADVMMAVEAGFIGGFGLNESGVGICGTVLAAGGRRRGLLLRLSFVSP